MASPNRTAIPAGGSLTLIYLVYNEEPTLASVLAEAVDFCQNELDADWEILVVDDGSSDQSNDIARATAARVDGVRVLTHEVNQGMGAAMATGIAGATKSHFVFLSADGQAPVRELHKLVPLLADADIVVSTYEAGRHQWRTVMSGGLRLFMRATAGIRFPLEGLYVFPTAVAHRLAPEVRADTFFFSFELIDRALADGKTLTTTTMIYLQREHGASKVANLRRIYRVGKEVVRYAARKRGVPGVH